MYGSCRSGWGTIQITYDGVIKWKHFPRYWPFVRGIHRSPVNYPHKGQWRGALIFSLVSQITGLSIVYSTVCSVADQKKTLKRRVTGLCEGKSPVTAEFSAQIASNAENFYLMTSSFSAHRQLARTIASANIPALQFNRPHQPHSITPNSYHDCCTMSLTRCFDVQMMLLSTYNLRHPFFNLRPLITLSWLFDICSVLFFENNILFCFVSAI